MCKYPRIIALCGRPKSGKTTLAEILKRKLNYEIVDDATPLRQIGVAHFGLSIEDVTTQAGKARELEFINRQWTVREILGEIGNALEDKFGPDIIPAMAYSKMRENKNYVLPSVRKAQGIFWKSKGAVVIEVINPYVGESSYEFDQYDQTCIDFQVINDFDPTRSSGLSEIKSRNRFFDRFCKVMSD